MPKSYEQDTSFAEGARSLSEALQGLADEQRQNSERALKKMENENGHINALAQLVQSIGLYSGEPQFDNEALSKETRGLLQVKPKTAGTKKAETEAKLSEGQAKRDFAKLMGEVKYGQQLDLEQVKWAHSMAKIEELAKTGDKQAAFKALMNHVNAFGVTGGAADVNEAKRAVQEAKGEPLTPDQKPLEQQAGGATGGILGMGQKTATHKDLIESLGSEGRANQAEQDWTDIQSLIKSNPKSAAEWEKKFFEEYPVLRGKIGFK